MDTKCYHISLGPSKSELFSALKYYPKKKVMFEIALSQTCDYNLLGEKTDLPYFSVTFEMFIRSIEAILIPCCTQPLTIDMMKDTWLVEGFLENENKLFYQLKLMYNTKNKVASIYLKESEKYSLFLCKILEYNVGNGCNHCILSIDYFRNWGGDFFVAPQKT